MISASHNPMPDNGIKLFSRAGTSCPTPSRRRSSAPSSAASDGPPADRCGRRPGPRPAGAVDDYVAHLLSTVDRR
jgi:phosphoglucosamine mutase